MIQSYRDRGLTSPFTVEVMVRAGVKENLAPRTLLSLKILELIDESGSPTPAMESLRRAPEAEFKTRLEEIVRGVYAEVFAFTDPAKDDTGKITDAFRAYDPPGQRDRMVTLFLGLCEAAGIIAEGKKPTVNAGRQQVAGTARAPAKRRAELQPSGRPGGFRRNLKADDDTIVPEAITGMIRSIPFDGWTEKKRDAFVTLFRAVLDYTVPIISVDARGDKIEE